MANPMEGYLPIEHFQETDDDHTAVRIRDMPYGKRRESLSIYPIELNFPATPVGQVSPPYPIMITNDGYDVVVISKIKIVGDFTLVGNITTLAPGQHASLSVIFTPKRNDITTGGVYLDSGSAAGEEFIALSGMGGEGSGYVYDTREHLVEQIELGFTIPGGQVLTVEGYSYISVPGSTAIPDLHGFEPYGEPTPQHFGAVANDLVDDTPSLNAFFNYFRIKHIVGPGVPPTGLADGSVIRGIIPPGIYRCGNVNATGIKASNWILDCRGAILHGVIAGKPVLDMMGTRWFTINDLVIYGDAVNTPTFGIQHGRENLAATSRGEVSFMNCTIDGCFSKACYVNMGAEICTFWHPTMYNKINLSTAYVVIFDGRNQSGILSDYITMGFAVNTNVGSFLMQTWVNADLRKVTTGKCVQIIGNVSQIEFINSYWVSYDNAAIYISNGYDLKNLKFEGHFETAFGNPKPVGISCCVLIDNVVPAQNVIIINMQIKDHAPQCNKAIIDVTGKVRTVALDGCQVIIGIPTYKIPVIGDTAQNINLVIFSGKISWWDYKYPLDMSNMLFTGDVETTSMATQPIIHGAGSYQIVRRGSTLGDRGSEFKGTVRAIGTNSSPNPQNYIEMLGGDGPGSKVILQSGGSDNNIDVTLKGKGTGRVVSTSVLAVASSQPHFHLDKIPSAESTINFRTNESDRWRIYTDSTPESGGNLGSAFRISRHGDDGGLIDAPFVMLRSTGETYIQKLVVSNAVAPPVGGSTAAFLRFGTTGVFGIYYGSGVPTISAGKGSLYMRTDGTSNNTRMYVNTNDGTTWTAVMTVA